MLLKEVVLYRGMTEEELKRCFENNFNDLSWWTDDIEDLRDYHKGAILKIKVKINEDIKEGFIHEVSISELLHSNYTFGYINIFYTTTNWYSFSKDYLQQNVILVEDLSHIIGVEV